MPTGIHGPVASPEQLSAYANRFLQDAADRGVQIIGLTPHSPRLASDQRQSAVWTIVQEWQTGSDERGIPFRERIYAIFPGFEPSLNHGRDGLHLLFLFDIDIGIDNYLKAFDLVMGGVSPWSAERGSQLQMSNRTAAEAFEHLQSFNKRESRTDQDGRGKWDYIVLAPHIDGEKGLLESQKSQVLELFRHDQISGLELGDNKLPDDTLANRPWLLDGMQENRQSFFHSSDAYSTAEIGTRHAWIKAASPRIESLRQAFLAGDSRIRIGFESDSQGQLVEIEEAPDVTISARPWLRSVCVRGDASFFGGGRETAFPLSPDLTCIIGGSMTGKSTFLDGLRIHIGGLMPEDDGIRKQVEARGRDRFLAGSAEVELDCPGQDMTAPLNEQWPAVFYSQTELQRLSESADAVEEILSRLVPTEAQDIEHRERQLKSLDASLKSVAKCIEAARDEFAESDQALSRSQAATSELEAFSNAGVDEVNEASSNRHRWQQVAVNSASLTRKVNEARDSLRSLDIPGTSGIQDSDETDDRLTDLVGALHKNRTKVDDSLERARRSLAEMSSPIEEIGEAVAANEATVQEGFDRSLAALGLDGARISQLQALNEQAALLESSSTQRAQLKEKLRSLESEFSCLRARRDEEISKQRSSFDRVLCTVQTQFGGRIIARRIDEDRKEPLDQYLRNLSQRGITRWWNDLSEAQRPTVSKLLECMETGRLTAVGMSEAVEQTFREHITPARKLEIQALRCRDRYVLEFRVDDDKYRDLSKLSGGQRVSLLLSLLLETSDSRPLVIDQPEDELDNRFLFDTMLPALKRLKGKRQIILATHKADIVVNGDADLVIQLDATSDRGHIECFGAIEDPAVRDAIVQTVDGGDEAFQLRRAKYGF